LGRASTTGTKVFKVRLTVCVYNLFSTKKVAKIVIFLMLFLMLSQPFCYGLFLAFSDKAKGYKIFTLSGALITSIFLFVLIPSLFGGVAYYVLNSAINSEW